MTTQFIIFSQIRTTIIFNKRLLDMYNDYIHFYKFSKEIDRIYIYKNRILVIKIKNKALGRHK